jgi:hypothetical protein
MFGRDVEVLYRESRRGEAVRVCLLEDQSGHVIPEWMFEPTGCAAITVGAPRVSIPAIADLRLLLADLGFDRHAVRPPCRRRRRSMRQERQLSTLRSTKQLALVLQPTRSLASVNRSEHDDVVSALARLLLEAVALAEVDDDAP